MASIKREIIVAATPEAVYDIVADVGRYPEFLSDIQRVVRNGDIVEMTAQVGPMALTFANRARFNRPHAIDLELISGPFKSMRARWSFEPIAAATPGDVRTRVRYEATFELALKLPGANAIAAAALTANADRTVEAFRRRAESQRT